MKNLTEWTPDRGEAFDFQSASVAVDFCRDFNWPEINILLIKEGAKSFPRFDELPG
ncbi:MAG: hypothetical protein M3Y82_04805 [Verrucomicrobiota bacterium]|nr:hypothetical protein [Verrucomicrobiota bacterium]